MKTKAIAKTEKNSGHTDPQTDPIVEWLATIGETRIHTLEAYTDGVFVRAMPYLRGVHPSRIGPAEAEYVVRQLRTKYSPATVNQTISALSSLWKHFIRRGITESNPWQYVSRETPEVKVGEKYLTRDEVKRLARAATSLRDRALVLFLYVTGARVSEAVRPRNTPENSPRGLRWKNLRFEPDGWAYATLYGKGGKTRTVGVRPEVARMLKELHPHPSPDDPVFPISRIDAFVIIRRLAKKAGINKPVSPHWLRHSHAVHALERGAPINLVQATLGHARLDTTGVYLKIRPGKGTGKYL